MTKVGRKLDLQGTNLECKMGGCMWYMHCELSSSQDLIVGLVSKCINLELITKQSTFY